MKRDLKTLAGLNPYPTNSGKGWSTSTEGRDALESAMTGGEDGIVELVASVRPVVRPWAVAAGAAAVTLAVFALPLLRGDPSGPVGAPVVPTQPPSTATSTSIPGEPSGPSTELLSYLLPISGTEVASVNYITLTGQHEHFDSLGACMEGEGFDFDFQMTTPPDFVSNGRNAVLAYDSLQKYGFVSVWSSSPPGLPPGVAHVGRINDGLGGLIPLPEGMSEAEARAIVDAHQDCLMELSARESVPSLSQFNADHDQLAGNFVFAMYELDDTHPDIVAALADFQGCVRGRGWVLRTTNDSGVEDKTINPFLAAVQTAVFSTDDPDEQQEIDARGVADLIDCIEPVEAIRQPLRADLREAYVDENWAALIEAERRFAAVLRELGLGPQN